MDLPYLFLVVTHFIVSLFQPKWKEIVERNSGKTKNHCAFFNFEVFSHGGKASYIYDTVNPTLHSLIVVS